MKHAFGGIFEGMKVLITGHTGFKGSWLALWLQELGAHVIGYSLPPSTDPSNFTVSGVSEQMISIQGDIRDYDFFKQTLDQYKPELVFHLAAQPLVLRSFEFPKETFDVNLGGTVNILEAARQCSFVKAMVMVTSDKCYENQEWIWGYREGDKLGGKDPYSASKSMAEKAIISYRESFSGSSSFPAIASARAGNVIGGGDFSEMRIVPDCMKALLSSIPIRVRNPASVRPWLNVLDPLSGYLCLAAGLLQHGNPFAEAWNFGPLEYQAVDVKSLVEKSIELWGDGEWYNASRPEDKPETGLLRLNWDKAANKLLWRPTYTWVEAVQQTVDWFREFRGSLLDSKKSMREVCIGHIDRFVERAETLKNPWALNNIF